MRCIQLFVLIATLSARTEDLSDDWLQFQHNPQNHGRAPRPVEPPFRLRWMWWGPNNVQFAAKTLDESKAAQPPGESVGLLSYTMSPVVADGRVFFGDLEGCVYALDGKNGTELWRAELGGSIVHCAAIHKPGGGAEKNVVVVPCQDGGLYGFNWYGKQLWRAAAKKGFVAAVKIDAGVAYAGALDGTMLAIDAASGNELWRVQIGAPIRQPVAINDGKVFFGSEDMIFHALNASDGKEIWRTSKGQMKGQSFRNTWPVAVGGKVLTHQILVDGMAEFVMEGVLWNGAGDIRARTLKDWPAERDAILGWLRGDLTHAYDTTKPWSKDGGGKPLSEGKNGAWSGGPFRKSLFVFDASGDGRGNAIEVYQVPMGIVGGTGNSNMGPALDPEGRPLLWWRVSTRSIFTGGSFGSAFAPDISALDLQTGDRIPLTTTRDIYKRDAKSGHQVGGPGVELDNHHMLTTAGPYIYLFNPFRQLRWLKVDGKENPIGRVSVVYREHDGGNQTGDVVFYPNEKDVGKRAGRMFDSHGAARTAAVIANGGVFCNEIDLRGLACYESNR